MADKINSIGMVIEDLKKTRIHYYPLINCKLTKVPTNSNISIFDDLTVELCSCPLSCFYAF